MARRKGSPGARPGDVFTHLLITCEHAGNKLPREHARLFARSRGLLNTHRGYDRGALPLARAMAMRLHAPLLFGTMTRLLVDLNRSADRPAVFSEVTRKLDPAQRALLIDRYWTPHRQAVEREIDGHISAGGRVLHIGVHTFTPVLRGVRRTADVGLLYDPKRPLERSFCDAWLQALAAAAPKLRLRRNYPYLGTSDGLTTSLRDRFPKDAYAGIELEMNQSLLRGRTAFPPPITRAVVQSLATLLS